ncbi:MAG: hypothetical protein ACI3Y7_01360 [Candidatus Cryptobacteroides sp.]
MAELPYKENAKTGIKYTVLAELRGTRGAVAIGLGFAFVKLFLPLLYETDYNRRSFKKIGKE